MHDIHSFLNSIKYFPEGNIFDEVTIEKVVLNKKEEIFHVYLRAKKVLPIEAVDALFSSCQNKINGEYKCDIILNYDEITENDCLNYVNAIVKRLTEKKPSLISLLECAPTIDDDIIIFEVMSPTEEESIKKEEANIRKILSSYGLNDYFITTKLNEELRKNVEEELIQVQAPIEYKEIIREFIFYGSLNLNEFFFYIFS